MQCASEIGEQRHSQDGSEQRAECGRYECVHDRDHQRSECSQHQADERCQEDGFAGQVAIDVADSANGDDGEEPEGQAQCPHSAGSSAVLTPASVKVSISPRAAAAAAISGTARRAPVPSPRRMRRSSRGSRSSLPRAAE